VSTGRRPAISQVRRQVETTMESFTGRWGAREGWTSPLPEWDGPTTLVLVFGGSSLIDDPAPLRAVTDRYPGSVVMGCSTSGEISGQDVYDDGLSVAVTRFTRTRLVLAAEPIDEAGSGDVGRSLGSRLRAAGDDLAAVFVLSDGITANGSTLAAGLAEGAGGLASISGGLAGDGSAFVRTWVLVDGRPTVSHVTAVGLYGASLDVGCGSRGGWTILGPERMITRAEGNVLLELDGQPALELYKTYLGERAAGLPATAMLFPLGVRAPGSDQELVRSVFGVDERRQSMTFSGDLPEGAVAQLLRSTTDRLVDAAQHAATDARLPGDEPSLAIAVSCVGRRLYLGQRSEEELEAVVSGLGPDASLVGFYSYGELSPLRSGGCDLHNQTMTITVLRERAA
jgi:hypothetical protein